MRYTDTHTRIVARCFIKELQNDLSHQWQLDEIRRRNDAETDPRICHSHDFIDANMAMDEAIFAATGLRPGDFEAEQQESMGLTKLWDDAWAMAKAARFIPTKIPQQNNPMTIDEIIQLPGFLDLHFDTVPARPDLQIKAHILIELRFRNNPDGRRSAVDVAGKIGRKIELRQESGMEFYSINHLILRENP